MWFTDLFSMSQCLKIKVCFISPSIGSGCGVADYTSMLAHALANIGAEVSIISRKEWNLLGFIDLLKRIKNEHPDICHIQYPSQPYGHSAIINVLGFFLYRKCVISIHEFSQAKFLRRISCCLLARCASHIIFTSEFERTAMSKICNGIKDKSSVIPIGSNVPLLNQRTSFTFGDRIGYFGLIRERKGLDEFFQLVEICKNKSDNFKFYIIGTPQSGQDIFFREVMKRAHSNGVHTIIGASPNRVAALLNSMDFVYLHYPDGASDRRGSLIAALGNGPIVLSNTGCSTGENIANLFVDCQDSTFAYRSIVNIRDQKEVGVDRNRLVKFISARSWSNIALDHLAVYKRVLNGVKSKFGRRID